MANIKEISKSNSKDKLFPDRVAAIDIGSNAMRMQIFERDSKKNIHIIQTIRRPVRLGRDVFHNGKILAETFDAAMDAMSEFGAAVKEYGVSQVAAVATSAVREASNGPAFTDRVKRQTGFNIEIISGAEEARLVISAILERMPLAGLNALHIEVGGGSAEVSLIEDAEVKFSLTHELGAVRLIEAFNNFSGNESGFGEIVKEYIRVTQKRLKNTIGKKKIDRFIATGGNIDSIVWLLEQTKWGMVERDKGIPRIELSTLLEAVKRLSVVSYRERVEQLHIRPDRADVILPAAFVYAGFAEMAKAQWIYAPGVGVRDGLAIDLFRREEKPHRDEKHKQLISAVKALGEKYEYDATHAEIVSAYALEIFDELRELHGLNGRERILLEIAALLHDVGYFVNISRHHKHSYYLVSESEIGALSPRDIIVVANIARYHRKTLPKEQHENYRALSEKEKEIILKLASILRVADALDRERPGVKMPISVNLTKNKLVIGLPASKDRGLERWAMTTKGDMFAEVFGYNVEVN